MPPSCREESLADVAEDSWAALLVDSQGQPLSAASLLVFGQDHARLEVSAAAPAPVEHSL